MNDNKPLIQPAEYRRQNGLKQADLAKIFDTSPSYVSLVETGNAKLSRKCLENFWNSEGIVKVGLVPAYDRLVQLASSLNDQGRCKSTPAYPDNDSSGRYEPFEHVFTREAILNIKYGVTGVTDNIVYYLQVLYDTQISKDWLISGIGEMFTDNTMSVLLDTIEQFERKLKGIEGRLDTLQAMIDRVLNLLEKE